MMMPTLDMRRLDLWVVPSCASVRRQVMYIGYRVKSPMDIPSGSTLLLSRTHLIAAAVALFLGSIMASTGEGPLTERSLSTVGTMPNPSLAGPLVAGDLISSIALVVTWLIRLTLFGP